MSYGPNGSDGNSTFAAVLAFVLFVGLYMWAIGTALGLAAGWLVTAFN